ncbi:MAG TPA: amidohydrolase/deacetylase family metallohydrolase [Bryobacteraceae bacterium]|nr:amidohydrolase/deacetylase family metallohydrolase [Bryobacteraceae bacterium]
MRIFRFLLVALSGALLASAQPAYDLLLKGGHVIDPKNHIDAVRDVAIANGKIAAVAENISPSEAHKVVDVSSLYVTPGLVDIHVHVYAGTGAPRVYAGDWSVYPDGFTFRTGVTTVVDAGTSGWRTFPDFKQRVIDRARTRVLAMLNIVGGGMGPDKVQQNTADMDPQATAKMAKQYPGVVVGIKTAHYRGPEWIAVDRGLEAARLAGVPLMVDFGTFRPERPFEVLVGQKLRPGDIYTHTYLAAVPMLDDQGRVRPYLFAAQKRGVIFDVGHGGGSFIFRYAVPAIRQGFWPNSISTDLHWGSMNAGMKNLLNVMSKFLNMGLSVQDVVVRTTWNPAREIHREELGNLSVGAPADVTVLSIAQGHFGFVDVYGAKFLGSKKFLAELTVRNGKVEWDLNGLTRDTWDKLGRYGPLGDRRWDDTISEGAHSRK